MAKGAKLKKQYKTTREGPSKSQQRYIEKVTSPRTPEDLELALQNPSSPAYKQMVNLVAARMENHAIMEHLVHIFLVEQHVAAQREKDEVFKELLVRELAQQKEFKQYQDAQLNLASTKIPMTVEVEKMKEQLEIRAQVIVELKNDITQIKNDIAKLDERAQKNSQAWQETTQRHRKAVLDLGVQFVSSSGKIIDKNDSRYEALAKPAAPDITKLVDVVALSYKLHEAKPAEGVGDVGIKDSVKQDTQEVTDKNIPAPPPPPSSRVPAAPPPPPTRPLINQEDVKKHMVGITGVTKQLKEIYNSRDSDSIEDFFKALKEDKKKYRLMSQDTKDQLGKLEKQYTEEIKGMIDTAFDIHNEKSDKLSDLMTKEIDLKRIEVIQEVQQKVFDERMGKVEEKSQLSIDEPASNAHVKSTG